MWDAVTGQRLDVFSKEHTDFVAGVAFSADGKVLASCSADKSIILWDVAAHESIGRLLTEDQADVYALVFSPNGALISVGWGVTYWDVTLDALRSHAEQMAARNLTLEEWKHFLEDRPYRPTSPYASLKDADMLALNGDENAKKAFKNVVDVAVKSKDALLNNQVGWYGDLDDLAEIVLPACDRAVELARAEERPNYRDSRGVALALTGKFPGAMEDFGAVVIWLKTEEEKAEKAKEESSSQAEKEKHERIATEWKKMRVEREEWIAKLKSGQNPIDNETLKTLRREHVPTSE